MVLSWNILEDSRPTLNIFFLKKHALCLHIFRLVTLVLPSFPQFYTEVTEVETWIREKLPRVSSDDYGRDETMAQSLLRKHETLELELDSYRAKVGDLRNTCQVLVTAGNFDAEKIQRRQVIRKDL